MDDESSFTSVCNEDIIVPPLLLGSESAATVIDAWMSSMSKCGLDLCKLASAFPVVVLFVAMDSCFVNSLAANYLDHVCPSDVLISATFAICTASTASLCSM